MGIASHAVRPEVDAFYLNGFVLDHAVRMLGGEAKSSETGHF